MVRVDFFLQCRAISEVEEEEVRVMAFLPGHLEPLVWVHADLLIQFSHKKTIFFSDFLVRVFVFDNYGNYGHIVYGFGAFPSKENLTFSCWSIDNFCHNRTRFAATCPQWCWGHQSQVLTYHHHYHHHRHHYCYNLHQHWGHESHVYFYLLFIWWKKWRWLIATFHFSFGMLAYFTWLEGPGIPSNR